ncbi:hypothetical protein BLA29_014789 [Euroglyphus maynei]|uniref:Uncharacterized protein n=1 Tax=Euroglyphus maynei TaxID=6958 RepID=A0A1Y3APC4_EURMA|nr:hypothetical protein BLA29_014789 [Euroglyphus maynei]
MGLSRWAFPSGKNRSGKNTIHA